MRRQPTPRVTHSQTRPPREVVECRRTVTGEVAPDQLRDCLVPLQHRRRWHTLFEQRIGVLFALKCATADHAVKLGMRDEVRQHCAVGNGDPGRSKCGAELRSRAVFAAFEGPRDDHRGLRDQLIVQPELPIAAGHATFDAGRSERQHPADVRGRHEVPRRPQHVRAQDLAPVEGTLDRCPGRLRHAQPERP